MMSQLSVIIITQNEAHQIDQCLASVSWCDEIVVVDSSSTDDTVIQCRQFTNNIFIIDDWQGFGVLKNSALAKATGEWVLSIDADERVSPALQQEIQQAITHPTISAFRIPRQSYYCGRQIKHSGWSPDYVVRLFRRQCAYFTNDLVHEKVQVLQGNVGTLTAPLIHYSFTSVEEVLAKINRYSSLNAQMHYDKGKRATLTKAIGHGVWAFVRTYLLRAGFLDGREGFMLAVSNAEGTYYHYIKLLYLQKYAKNQRYSDHL
jgi:glycosyltransferase involved in cell wall biosynthesis